MHFLFSKRVGVAVLLAAFLAVTGGCRRHKARKTVAIPQVTIEEVAGPAQPSVTFQSGMNLRTIAAGAYGHPRMSGLVLLHNHLADEAQIAEGTNLDTPSIPRLFQQEGLDARYQPAVNVLARAWADYSALVPAYKNFRLKAHLDDKGKITLPPEMKAKLEQIAADVESADKYLLQQAVPPHTKPQKAANQFAEAVAQMRSIAGGTLAEYDTEMVGQRFAYGFINLLVWTQAHHQ